MSVFPDWEKYAVHQKRPESGCIPTGYEMLLRAAQVPGIDFDTFQDEFDLDKDRQENDAYRNNFESVALAVNQKYPHIHFIRTAFTRGQGRDKLRFIEEHINKREPILISLAMMSLRVYGYHIMPVVDATEQELTLLNHIDVNGLKQIIKLQKSELIRLHDTYDGGDDVAFLVIAGT